VIPLGSSKPLPLTESLVFDIVEYLLDNDGYGFSTQISETMVANKPRRYTSREVIGVLRNRPMFKHAQSKDRRGGIRWRLDLLSLVKYFENKNYVERAEDRSIYDRVRELKWKQLIRTVAAMESLLPEIENPRPETIDECYEILANLWS
jgi:hypothetical protein